jgi:agmatine deiminase
MKQLTELSTPLKLGFHMPAEWEPHQATWLAWPHEVTDWPGKFAPIPWVYAEIVRHVAEVERVYLLVEDQKAESRVRTMLKKSGANLSQVDFFCTATDRGWMRDIGPTCLVSRNEMAYAHWKFTGWAKYDNYKKDAVATAKVNQKLKRRVWQPEHKGRKVVLEGGSIDVNGRGTLITTEECLLSSTVQERNPGFSKADYEEIFQNYLGVTNVLWLKDGIAGDDTHGHVDDLTRFVNPTTVVTVVEENPSEVNFAPLQENLERLKSMKDQDGRPLKIETLPMPAPVWFGHERLPASYANFYIANGIVIVPTFNDPNDRIALNTIAGLFPSRKVIGIYCRDLVGGQGTLHCLTQQEPTQPPN